MGMLRGLMPRIALVQSHAAATPGSGKGSGGMRFRRVRVHMVDEVPEGSVADG